MTELHLCHFLQINCEQFTCSDFTFVQYIKDEIRYEIIICKYTEFVAYFSLSSTVNVISHRRRTITRCVNEINGKFRTIYILMILSHCMRDAALRVQCERTIKIYKVLIFPLIALTHRVIARRLCERTFILKGQNTCVPMCLTSVTMAAASRHINREANKNGMTPNALSRPVNHFD